MTSCMTVSDSLTSRHDMTTLSETPAGDALWSDLAGIFGSRCYV